MELAHKNADAVIGVISLGEIQAPKFYGKKLDSGNRVKFFIQPSKLVEWLTSRGYRSYNDQFVKVVQNVAEAVDEKDIYKACLQEVNTFDNDAISSDFITKGASLILNQKGTVLALPELETEFLRDTEEAAYLFYKNAIVKVDKDSVRLLNYNDIDKLIWKEKIKDRSFGVLQPHEFVEAMYCKFMQNISDEDEHLLSISTSLGYLMLRHKTPKNVKAVIVNDISLSIDGSPQGGTGKGLLMKGVGKIINVVTLNGKNFNLKNDRFAMQNVDRQTDVIYIDDADRNLDFEQFFSTLSENTEIERKNKDKIQIPFKFSPKTAMTTNYAIKGVSSSHLRRKHNVYVNGHYDHEHTPYDEFGCDFFYQWDEKEWNRFDNTMVMCIQDYLKYGLVSYETEELKEKMLINQTSVEFWEVMENQFSTPKTSYSKGSVRAAMEVLSPMKRNTSFKMIKKWIDMYAAHKGFKVEHRVGTANVSFFEFIKMTKREKNAQKVRVELGK